MDTSRDRVTSKAVQAPPPRRQHSSAFKREVVEACLKGDASVSMVARQYDVNANQVFKWRKQYGDGLLTEGKTMLPVVIEGTPAVVTAAPEPATAAPEPAASIELQLPGGHVSLHGAVDPDTLRQVVALLSRR